MTFKTTSVEYTWITITQIVSFMTWSCGSTTNANFMYAPSIPQKRVPINDHYSITLEFITDYHFKDTFKTTTHLEYNFLRLPLQRHFKYQFPQLNHPRMTEEYSADTLLSSAKLIGGGWCDQLLCENKDLFGDVYGMETQIQGGKIWIPSQVSVVHLSISSPKIPRWSKAKPLYR